MTKHPPAVNSEYQAMLERAVRQPGLRRPMTTDNVARVTASSLRLEGFEVSPEELRNPRGQPGK